MVGVNVVEDHVERARRYARERHLGAQVRFEVADYARTGLPPSSFDVVWAQESACHAPDKSALAAEAFRVLRPGGRLVMAEYHIVPGRESSADLRVLQDGWAMTLDTEAGWRATFEAASYGPRGGQHQRQGAPLVAPAGPVVRRAGPRRRRAAEGGCAQRRSARQRRGLDGAVAGIRGGRLALRDRHGDASLTGRVKLAGPLQVEAGDLADDDGARGHCQLEPT